MKTPRAKTICLGAGPVFALIAYILLPEQYLGGTGDMIAFGHPARATLAMLVWMAIWWLTEATDIRVTALLPVTLFPVLNVSTIKAAAAPYASHIIFLLLGGFLIATAIQRWGLDRRIALGILSRVGNTPSRIVGGFMLVTAFLSAFISNTATTAMMLPIGLSVIGLVALHENSRGKDLTFSTCIMLAIAYSASIGGVATIIGTMPNSFVVSFIRDAIDTPYQQDISFLEWSQIGLPIVLVLLPICWLLLTKIIYKVDRINLPDPAKSLERKMQAMGPLSYQEKAVLGVFGFTVFLWLSRAYLQGVEIMLDGQMFAPLKGLSDAGIAMLGAIMLFVIPSRSGTHRCLLQWEDLKSLPWGILFLLGGGLSLARAVQANGVTEFIGAQASDLSFLPMFLILLAIVGAVVFLTELTSNTATTATLIPVLAAIAPALNIHPYTLVIPASIAASCAFMLPVATPPNAIVFGSGHITSRQMRSTGLWLNLICLAVITLLAYYLSSVMIRLVAG